MNNDKPSDTLSAEAVEITKKEFIEAADMAITQRCYFSRDGTYAREYSVITDGVLLFHSIIDEEMGERKYYAIKSVTNNATGEPFLMVTHPKLDS